VLRSYDNRFRLTDRSSEIYLSPKTLDIVGEVMTILKLPEEGEADDRLVANPPAYLNHSFWDKSNGRTLLVIATPYRPGGHVAERPKAFLPIIDQLEKLHENGFVHGDIRAFNTVFGKSKTPEQPSESKNETMEQLSVPDPKGWLIDFDFGGKLETTRYPKGYRTELVDGDRLVEEDESIILKWHDWYALGRLIFEVHKLVLTALGPEEKNARTVEISGMNDVWLELKKDPEPEEIAELRRFLCSLDDAGVTVDPNRKFQVVLKKLNTAAVGCTIATKRGATGSPPK
jgi:hypothetical protein